MAENVQKNNHLSEVGSKSGTFRYALHLADNALVLGQRNSEWCAHGPVLEQDIALTNIALDLLGQARNFYQYAANIYESMTAGEKAEVDLYVPTLWKAFNRKMEEDDLSFLRDEHQFLNLLLCELPNGDWAQTILRQFFVSAFQYYQYKKLINSTDARLAAIAEKSLKEVTYHLRWSSEWVIRLGDGTAESKRRMEKARTLLWSYIGEFFIPASYEQALLTDGIATDAASLVEDWRQKLSAVFLEATLFIPINEVAMHQGGKEGKHTEHLKSLLLEMQFLPRTYPNATW